MKNFSAYLSLMALAATAMACSEEGPMEPPCSTPPEITAVEVEDAGCNGTDGSLEIVAGGGTGMLLYSLNEGPFQAASTFTQLTPGSYNVQVKDEEGCLSSQEVVVGELASTLSVEVVSMAESGCGQSEGSVQLSAAGGEAAYQFSLDGAAYQEEGVFNGLEANEYTAHVKDAAGCVETTNFAIQSGISFNTSVKSIIEANCAVSGCHVAGTGRADLTQFSEIKDRAATIKSYIQSGYMPPQGSGKSLSSDEIAAIVCWVDDGAPQN